MKTLKEFTVGSSRFFSGYDDYNSKDIDYLRIVTDCKLSNNSFRISVGKNDVFIYPDTVDMIRECLESGQPVLAGKFLVPEVMEYMHLSIDDLHIFKPLLKCIDDKHAYELYILNCYFENGDSRLTKEQLDEAYAIYKKYKT